MASRVERAGAGGAPERSLMGSTPVPMSAVESVYPPTARIRTRSNYSGRPILRAGQVRNELGPIWETSFAPAASRSLAKRGESWPRSLLHRGRYPGRRRPECGVRARGHPRNGRIQLDFGRSHYRGRNLAAAIDPISEITRSLALVVGLNRTDLGGDVVSISTGVLLAECHPRLSVDAAAIPALDDRGVSMLPEL